MNKNSRSLEKTQLNEEYYIKNNFHSIINSCSFLAIFVYFCPFFYDLPFWWFAHHIVRAWKLMQHTLAIIMAPNSRNQTLAAPKKCFVLLCSTPKKYKEVRYVYQYAIFFLKLVMVWKKIICLWKVSSMVLQEVENDYFYSKDNF